MPYSTPKRCQNGRLVCYKQLKLLYNHLKISVGPFPIEVGGKLKTVLTRKMPMFEEKRNYSPLKRFIPCFFVLFVL